MPGSRSDSWQGKQMITTGDHIFAHMARLAAEREAKSSLTRREWPPNGRPHLRSHNESAERTTRDAARWISEHVKQGRRYKPPRERGLRLENRGKRCELESR